MNSATQKSVGERNAFDLLRRLASPKAPAERCELCSLIIGSAHPHLFQLATRQIVCACEACAILFSDHKSHKYKRIPARSLRFADFQITDAQWDTLAIPIGLAFFFQNSSTGRITSFYPSPAGATESLLDLTAWDELAAANPSLRKIDPDVEAFLVNRVGLTRDYYLTPIDECYKLVGLIRSNWKGLSGGTEVWKKVEEFFQRLNSFSKTI